MDIPLLNANEIECRVNILKGNGCSLLLYKDARVDMKILDQVYGVMNWTRKHEKINDNLFCTVSIYDKEKGEWISKQDVGIESYTQKEKGQASDSFKRACVNIGIGRELYTAPFIWIKLGEKEVLKNNGKPRLDPEVKFKVSEIGYNDSKEINKLVIVDQNNQQRYTLGGKKQKKKNAEDKPLPEDAPPIEDKLPKQYICKTCGKEIKEGKIGGIYHSAAQIANKTGGLCGKCKRGST